MNEILRKKTLNYKKNKIFTFIKENSKWDVGEFKFFFNLSDEEFNSFFLYKPRDFLEIISDSRIEEIFKLI